MSNIKNLHRDMHWFEVGQTALTWPTSTGRANCDGVVYQDIGTAYINANTGTANDKSAGVFLQQPVAESVPYRVKVMVSDHATQLMIAHANTTVVASNCLLSDKTYVPLRNGQIDEIFCVKYSGSVTPIFFGVQTDVSSATVKATISVQRLNIMVPRFASVVS